MARSFQIDSQRKRTGEQRLSGSLGWCHLKHMTFTRGGDSEGDMAVRQQVGRWVTRQDSGFKLRYWPSAREGRLVYYIGGEVVPKAIGRHWIGIFAEVDSVGLVEMTPKTVELSLDGQLVSRDGIDLAARITLTMSVIDQETAIRRVALHSEQEERVVTDAVTKCWQKCCGDLGYSEMSSPLVSLAEAVMKEVRDQAQRDRDGDTLWCFEIRNMLLQSLRIKDPVIGGAPVERVKATVVAEFEKARLEKEKDLAKIEAERRQQQLKDNLQEEEERLTAELKNQLQRFNQEIDQEKQRQLLAADEAREKAKIASEPGGLYGIAPDAALKIELKRLELREKEIRAFEDFTKSVLPYAVRGALQMGADDALRKIFRDKFRIDMSQIELSSDSQKLLQEPGAETTDGAKVDDDRTKSAQPDGKDPKAQESP